MNRILLQSSYPAPYRIELFDLISKEFETIVFNDRSEGGKRNSEWFSKGNYYVLDNEEGKQKLKETLKNFNQFDLVGIYEPSTILRFRLAVKYILSKTHFVLRKFVIKKCQRAAIYSSPCRCS